MTAAPVPVDLGLYPDIRRFGAADVSCLLLVRDLHGELPTVVRRTAPSRAGSSATRSWA